MLKIELKTLPSSVKEAREAGSPYYFTGKPCKRGHMDYRTVSTRNCRSCGTERAAEFKKSPKFKREIYADLPDEIKRKRLDTALQWKRQNKDYCDSYRNDWRDKNRSKVRTSNINRKKKVKEATPPWLSKFQKFQIELIYTVRDELNKIAGKVAYHVDHRIPLRGKDVCGLHVPWNLRVLTASDNMSKRVQYEQA